MAPCELCNIRKAAIKRPKNLQKICKECFFHVFETEIHQTIVSNKLFKRGERVAIGASGGKDSTVLAYVMKLLNERHDYGLDLYLLSIDEGIVGYRDDSLATVKRNQMQYDLPLKIVSYKDLYKWTMDEIVECAGIRNSCTYCGVLRRQALDRGSAMLGILHVITGHNADDMAETVLMNILRGDLARLEKSTAITTGNDARASSNNSIDDENSNDRPESEKNIGKIATTVKRSKPFKYIYQKEIVLYAHFKKLDYFSTECTYAPEAFRGTARILMKQLEKIRSSCISDIIYSGEYLALQEKKKKQQKGNKRNSAKNPLANEVEVNSDGSVCLGTKNFRDGNTCIKCGYLSSNEICKACVLLEGLAKSKAKVEVSSADGTAPFGGAKLVRELEKLNF